MLPLRFQYFFHHSSITKVYLSNNKILLIAKFASNIKSVNVPSSWNIFRKAQFYQVSHSHGWNHTLSLIRSRPLPVIQGRFRGARMKHVHARSCADSRRTSASLQVTKLRCLLSGFSKLRLRRRLSVQGEGTILAQTQRCQAEICGFTVRLRSSTNTVGRACVCVCSCVECFTVKWSHQIHVCIFWLEKNAASD